MMIATTVPGLLRRVAGAALFFFATASAASAQTTITYTNSSATTLRGGTYAASNLNNQNVLETKADSNASYARRVLLKFDTNTTIAAGTPIASASLTLTVAGGGTEARQLSAYYVTNSYDEAVVSWNNRKAGLPWSQPGGDRGARYDLKPIPSGAGSKVTFDVTRLVQAIVRGDFGSSRYTRVLLVDEGNSSSGSYKSFYSDTASDVSVRPTLVVTTAAATEIAASYVTVPPGGNVQAVLDRGGNIQLVAGATYAGPFVLRSDTTLRGNGASIVATTASAIVIPPSTRNITVTDLTVTSNADSVVVCGRNDSGQTSITQAPVNITLARVTIPTHRGKRGFEINCAGTFDSLTAKDIYDPADRDSQGLAILNSPGPVTIRGGYYEAGSENILVGGDTMKMVGVVPTGITIEDVTLAKPLAWRTDGIKRKVKNLLEFKTGRDVTVRRVRMDGSWKDAQEGWAIVLTPHAGGDIHDVLVEDCVMTNVSGAFQIMGREYSGIPTPEALSGFVAKRNRIEATQALGGRGILAVISGEPADLTFADNHVTTDGSTTLLYDPGSVLNADGTKRPGGPIGMLTITDNMLIAGLYSITLAGHQNATGDLSAGVKMLTVTGNTFADAAPALIKSLPMNTFVSRDVWDSLTMQ